MKSKSSLYMMGLAVALAFGAGYAARGPGHGAAADSGGGRAAVDGHDGQRRSGGDLPVTADARRTTDRRAVGQGGKDQPPFLPGHAAAWLAALARQDSDDELSKLQIAQACGRLDAAQAEELARECLRISNLVEHGDEATLKTFTDSSMADLVATQAVGRLVQLDPAQALALMQHGPEESVDHDLLRMVFGAVAKKDPAQAMSAAFVLPEEDRDAACEGVIRQVAKTDPQAALALLEKNSGTHYLINGVVTELAKTDPQAAIAAAAKEMLTGGGSYILSSLAGSSDEMQQQIGDWAMSYTGPEQVQIRAKVLEMMAGNVAAAARDFYAKIEASLPEEERGEAAAQVARSLLNSGSDEAKAWVDGLGEGPVKEAAMRSLVTTALSRGAYLRSGSGAITRNNIDAVLNGRVGQTRTNADFISPIDGTPIPGVPKVTAANLQNIVTGGLREIPADANLQNAAKWIGDMAPSDLKTELTGNLITQLQDHDGDAALQWIETLPEGDCKETLKRETQLKMQLKALQEGQIQGSDPDNEAPATGALLGAGAGAIIGSQR